MRALWRFRGAREAWGAFFFGPVAALLGHLAWWEAVALQLLVVLGAELAYAKGAREARRETEEARRAEEAHRAAVRGEVVRSIARGTQGRSLGLAPTAEQKRWN